MSDFVKEITDSISLYAESIDDVVDEAMEKATQEGIEELKNGDYEDQSGDYRKSFASKTTATSNTRSSTLYAKAPHYRLTHLLEFGHAKVGGGRTRAFPHWANAEVKAVETFEKEIEEGIKRKS